MLYKQVYITGMAGTLGTELCELLDLYDIPYTGSDKEIDIRDYNAICGAIGWSGCDVVIHCAGIIDVTLCETEKQLAYDVNVVGAENVAEACMQLGISMVQVSTDYVYSGDKIYTGDGIEGNYSTSDCLDPINYYAFTKTLADVAVRNRLKDALVVRLSFKQKGSWPYPKAFIDQYTSRDTVDVLADQILQATFAGMYGVVHLGTERKTVYDLAVRQSPNVGKNSIHDIKGVKIPKDTSLKLSNVPTVLERK